MKIKNFKQKMSPKTTPRKNIKPKNQKNLNLQNKFSSKFS